MNHAATAYFFHVNNNLNQKLNTMLQEPVKNDIDLAKAAIKSHTNDALSGDYPFLHFTPENEQTYNLGFFRGVSFTTNSITEEAPTVFLQDEKKEDIKIELSEENEKTLHY